MTARRTNITNPAGARSRRRQPFALLLVLLSGTAATSGCYLTLDSDELDAKAAGVTSDAETSSPDAGPQFTTSLDTPPIELDFDGLTTTRDPCVATTLQAREILTSYCADCHAPPGGAAGFSSILDFPTLVGLRSATAKDPATDDFVRMLVPGKPEQSRIYLRARSGEMPPTRPPSQPQLRRPTISSLSVLRTWIQSCLANDPAGAP